MKRKKGDNMCGAGKYTLPWEEGLTLLWESQEGLRDSDNSCSPTAEAGCFPEGHSATVGEETVQRRKELCALQIHRQQPTMTASQRDNFSAACPVQSLLRSKKGRLSPQQNLKCGSGFVLERQVSLADSPLGSQGAAFPYAEAACSPRLSVARDERLLSLCS